MSGSFPDTLIILGKLPYGGVIGIATLGTMNIISFIGLISPLIITYLLLYVTGVPLLEKKYKTNLGISSIRK